MKAAPLCSRSRFGHPWVPRFLQMLPRTPRGWPRRCLPVPWPGTSGFSLLVAPLPATKAPGSRAEGAPPATPRAGTRGGQEPRDPCPSATPGIEPAPPVAPGTPPCHRPRADGTGWDWGQRPEQPHGLCPGLQAAGGSNGSGATGGDLSTGGCRAWSPLHPGTPCTPCTPMYLMHPNIPQVLTAPCALRELRAARYPVHPTPPGHPKPSPAVFFGGVGTFFSCWTELTQPCRAGDPFPAGKRSCTPK